MQAVGVRFSELSQTQDCGSWFGDGVEVGQDGAESGFTNKCDDERTVSVNINAHIQSADILCVQNNDF